MAEVLTQTAPVAVQATETQKPEVKESLITRASKVSLESANPEKGTEQASQEAIKLDQATIEKIADPTLKAAVMEAHKSMQADYTRKTQELASKRKEMDSLKSQLEQSGSSRSK